MTDECVCMCVFFVLEFALKLECCWRHLPLCGFMRQIEAKAKQTGIDRTYNHNPSERTCEEEET